MTVKALILEFILATALAVVLIFLLTIGAVQLIDRVVGRADQPATRLRPMPGSMKTIQRESRSNTS